MKEIGIKLFGLHLHGIRNPKASVASKCYHCSRPLLVRSRCVAAVATKKDDYGTATINVKFCESCFWSAYHGRAIPRAS